LSIAEHATHDCYTVSSTSNLTSFSYSGLMPVQLELFLDEWRKFLGPAARHDKREFPELRREAAAQRLDDLPMQRVYDFRRRAAAIETGPASR
jgi:hypothetical protein